MKKDDWGEALRDYVQTQRQRNPIPDRDTLSPEEEWHCRVIGGEFLQWDQRGLDQIMQQRYVLKAVGFDPEPLIVITTSMPGLVAMKEIAPEPPPDLVYLLHEEFQTWESQHPVHSMTFHIPSLEFLRTGGRRGRPPGPLGPSGTLRSPACGSIGPGRSGEGTAAPPASTCGSGRVRSWRCSMRPSRARSS